MTIKKTAFLLTLSLLLIPTNNYGNEFFDFFNKWSEFNQTQRNIRSQGHSTYTKDSNPAKKINQKIALTDIRGNVVPQEIYDLKDKLLNADAYKAVGAETPRGILLVGPPGNGKTTIARALAHELDAEFIVGNASSFMNLYIGTGPAAVNELFDKAKRKLKAGAKHVIIFIDEIDSLGKRQESVWHNEANKTINALLTHMDGVEALDNITVLAATNAVDLVDEALKRSGRFDEIIEISLPDEDGRADILNYYLTKKSADAAQLDLSIIAQESYGMSGADMEGVVKKAATIAARNRHQTITQDDLDQAWKHYLENQSKRTNNQQLFKLR